MSNLVDLRRFIRIRWKLVELWEPKPGTHFFVKIGKLGLPYFYEFATNSSETSHIYYTRHYKSSGAVYFLLESKKIGKA